MVIVKKIGVWSAAKINALIGVFLGIIIAVIAIPIGFFAMKFGAAEDGLGVLMYGVFAPLIYGIFGLLGGLLFSWFYNLLSKWIGGIEIELSEKDEKKVKKR